MPPEGTAPIVPGMFTLEDIDLRALSAELREMFQHDPPEGYLRGKTVFRDAVVAKLGCSALEAEELVDTMESRGFLHFDGRPDERSRADASWQIEVEGPE